MVSLGTADTAALCCFIQESDSKCGEVRGELYPPGEQRGGFFFPNLGRWILKMKELLEETKEVVCDRT